MQKLNYFLIPAYLFVFVVESVVVGRWAVRIVYADTWVTGVWAMMLFILLLASLKNWNTTAGKVGVGVAVATIFIDYAADFYFNGF